MILTLVKNPDIIKAVSALTPRPFTVGFAAETENVLGYARDKLKRKNLDAIIANDVATAGTGFNSDDNAATLIGPKFEQNFDRRSKNQLARDLINAISKIMA